MTRHHDQKFLQNARTNPIDGEAYNGPRPTDLAFDPVDLYCFLVEHSTEDADITDLTDLFEQAFHELPALAVQEIRLEWTIPPTDVIMTENPGETDDPRDIVEVFVTKYIQHYTHRNTTPPLGYAESDRPPISANAESSYPPRSGSQTRSQSSSTSTQTRTPDEVIDTPLLSETAMAGYRTGRAIKHAASAAWKRLTTPVTGDTMEDPDDTGADSNP